MGRTRIVALMAAAILRWVTSCQKRWDRVEQELFLGHSVMSGFSSSRRIVLHFNAMPA